MEFTIGGDRCVLEPGDEVFIPAGAGGGGQGALESGTPAHGG